MRKIAFFIFCTCAVFAEDAITYSSAPGRFGDQLLNYLHAKWVSFKYDIPLYYQPFIYSNELKLSQLERPYDASKKYQQTRELRQYDNLDAFINAYKNSSCLFYIPYFPESAWERENHGAWGNWAYFDVDWKNPKFKTEIKKLVAPIHTLPRLQLPTDRITVAVHVRHGGGYDIDERRFIQHPAKFPPHSFYINGVRKIYQILNASPLYVFIFTDDPDPMSLIRMYKSHLQDCNIEFDCRKGENRHDRNVLEDFFNMTQFDCAVHADSCYSQCVGFISDYKLEITTGEIHFKNHQEVVVDLKINYQ